MQVLELLEEPGGVPAELHEVHHQPVVPPLPLHRGLCSAGDAAVRGPVSNHFLTYHPRLSWQLDCNRLDLLQSCCHDSASGKC